MHDEYEGRSHTENKGYRPKTLARGSIVGNGWATPLATPIYAFMTNVLVTTVYLESKEGKTSAASYHSFSIDKMVPFSSFGECTHYSILDICNRGWLLPRHP